MRDMNHAVESSNADIPVGMAGTHRKTVVAIAADRNVNVTRPSPQAVIAGCGAVTAVGVGVEALRNAMRANASGLRKCERFSEGRFQSNIAGAVLEDPEKHDDPAYELANQAVVDRKSVV